ncbi:hypothetical protein KEM52_005912 [Ascosphaera acerosa]|nr:hypothetical protein KEM52_005912 [Ascosphaera acerosa]
MSPSLPPIRDLRSKHEVQQYETAVFRAPHSPPSSGSQSETPSPTYSPYPQSPFHQQPFAVPGRRDFPPGIAMSSASSYVTHSGNGGDLSSSSSSKVTKKRRGNLPKKITDILRAWFHAHLDHPYPSEDDKQMLIEQTGLTISQHWFVTYPAWF